MLNWRIGLAVVTITFGLAFPAGHGLGVINTPQKVVREWLHDTIEAQYGLTLTSGQDATLWGVIVSSFMVGALCGSFLGTPLANNFGRRRAMLVTQFTSLVSGALIISCTWSGCFEFLLLGRLIAGLATGIGTSLTPLYLSEIVPPEWKGVMGVILPFGMCSAMLVSQCLGTANTLGTAQCWNYLVGGHFFYVFASLLLYNFLPRSPAYLLLIKNDRKAGIEVLIKLRNGDKASASKEAESMCSASEIRSEGIFSVLRNRKLIRPLLIAVVLNAGQQFIGINAVFFYSTLVFSKSGLGIEESQLASIGAGVANLLMSILAFPLVKFIRIRLLLITSIVLYVFFLGVFIAALKLVAVHQWAAWVAFSSVFLSVLSYGVGIGPVPFMVGTKIFSPSTRSAGLAIGGASNWGSTLAVGFLFPLLQNQIGIYSFLVFIAFGVLLLFFVHEFVLEEYGQEEAVPKPISGQFQPHVAAEE